MYACMYVCVSVCMYVCVYVCVYVDIYACTYMYACMYMYVLMLSVNSVENDANKPSLTIDAVVPNNNSVLRRPQKEKTVQKV